MAAQPTHVADASALIAYFKGEGGADVFGALLSGTGCVLAVHMVNLCEVYYCYIKSDGVAMAEQAWEKVEQIAGVLTNVDPQFMKRVGRWKVTHNLPLGDAFAATSAEDYGCKLVTTDHGDFDPVLASGVLDVMFLR